MITTNADWLNVFFAGVVTTCLAALMVCIVIAMYDSWKARAREEEAIARGLAKRIYDKDNYGRFVWLEKEEKQ